MSREDIREENIREEVVKEEEIVKETWGTMSVWKKLEIGRASCRERV